MIECAGREVSEMPNSSIADCPLGTEVAGKSFDKPEIEYDRSIDIRNCPLQDGHWVGERGDSKWIPDSDYVPQKCNPDGDTWGKILERHGIDGIDFQDGEPVFDDIARGTVKIEDYSSSRTDNFDKADIELSKQHGCSPDEVRRWRRENGYTWHECKDMATMQKVPSEIHGNIAHRGGISSLKSQND